jgi:hypothetical protein
MKEIGLVLISVLVPLACIVFAGIMAIKGVGGWGWFIFGAAITGTELKFKSNDKKENE